MAYRNLEEEVGGRIKTNSSHKRKEFVNSPKSKNLSQQRHQRFAEKRSQLAD